jgi:hypothetical protein
VRDLVAVTNAHLHKPPQPPSAFCPSLPPSIDAAVLKALSKDPAQRHASVHGLLFELPALHQTDPALGGALDTHSTDPMVGTIADGYPSIREEPDTIGPATLAPWEGPSDSAGDRHEESRAASAAFSQPEARPPGEDSHVTADNPRLAGTDATLYAANAASQAVSEDSMSASQPRQGKPPIDASSSGSPSEGTGRRASGGRIASTAAIALAAIAALTASLGAYLRKDGAPPTSITRPTAETLSSASPEPTLPLTFHCPASPS